VPALTPAAFVALLATCAPDAPANYLTAIAKTESSFHQFAVHDNTAQHSEFPETRRAAVAMVKERLSKGHSVDVGLLQVNNANWPSLGLTAETALDPCHNVAAGWRVLASFSRYNTGGEKRGFANGYVQKVISNLHAIPAQEPLSNHRKPRHHSVFVEPTSSSRQIVSYRKREVDD
jgi:type IV secretion system protein VirB1